MWRRWTSLGCAAWRSAGECVVMKAWPPVPVTSRIADTSRRCRYGSRPSSASSIVTIGWSPARAAANVSRANRLVPWPYDATGVADAKSAGIEESDEAQQRYPSARSSPSPNPSTTPSASKSVFTAATRSSVSSGSSREAEAPRTERATTPPSSSSPMCRFRSEPRPRRSSFRAESPAGSHEQEHAATICDRAHTSFTRGRHEPVEDLEIRRSLDLDDRHCGFGVTCWSQVLAVPALKGDMGLGLRIELIGQVADYDPDPEPCVEIRTTVIAVTCRAHWSWRKCQLQRRDDGRLPGITGADPGN